MNTLSSIFSTAYCLINRRNIVIFFCFCVIFHVNAEKLEFLAAELIDRVVAFVDDEPISMSEFKERYKKIKAIKKDVTKNEVINSMIDRLIIRREAQRLRIKGKSEDEIINQYINLKSRSFIMITVEDIEGFCKENSIELSDKKLKAVQKDIEKYLFEREIQKKLKKILEDLRTKAYIKIQLD